MKAADLPDEAVLLAVKESCRERGMWSNTSEIAERFPHAPFKVVAAKLSKLLKRDLLDGCGCGCRGDWELTAKGHEFLRAMADSPARSADTSSTPTPSPTLSEALPPRGGPHAGSASLRVGKETVE